MMNLRTQIVLPSICSLLVCVNSAMAQSPASLRWLTTIDRSSTTDTPGEHIFLGPQRSLLVEISLQNFEGPPVAGLANLMERLRIQVQKDGRVIDVRTEGAFRDEHGVGPLLGRGENIQAKLVITPNDGSAFDVGTYAVTISLAEVIRALQLENGERWIGRVKEFESRRIVIKNPVTANDYITFYTTEGNYHLGLRDYPRAILYLEPLIRLKPDDWRSLAALGEAYLQTKQYRDAVVVLARAFPEWMRNADRRAANLLPNNLARSYLALGRDADALQTLRAAGLSEREASDRVNQLRGRR